MLAWAKPLIPNLGISRHILAETSALPIHWRLRRMNQDCFNVVEHIREIRMKRVGLA